jgi:phosphatidylglycerophosphate synthase
MVYKFESYLNSWNKLSRAQKRSDVALPYTLWINRPIGRFFAVIAHKLSLTPNFVSFISLLFSVIGFLYLILIQDKEIIPTIFGVSILLFAYALDSADGQLARLTNIKGPSGEWLDHTADSIKTPMFHLSVFLVIYQIEGGLNLQVMIFFLMISAFASGKFFSSEIKEKMMANREKVNPGGGYIRSFLLAPFDYGFLCFIFILAPFNLLYPVYFFWGIYFILFCFASFIRSFRQLKNI